MIAFSPGFVVATEQRGRPRIFLSHGTEDTVIPIEEASRHIVRMARQAGYDVTYREFAGGHAMPDLIVRDAAGWFLSPTN